MNIPPCLCAKTLSRMSLNPLTDPVCTAKSRRNVTFAQAFLCFFVRLLFLHSALNADFPLTDVTQAGLREAKPLKCLRKAAFPSNDCQPLSSISLHSHECIARLNVLQENDELCSFSNCLRRSAFVKLGSFCGNSPPKNNTSSILPGDCYCTMVYLEWCSWCDAYSKLQ